MPTKLLIVALLIYCGVFDAISAVHQYVVQIDSKIAQASVSVCFDGAAPDYLAVEKLPEKGDLLNLPFSRSGKIEVFGRRWKTSELKDNACLSYKIDISRFHAKRSRFSRNRKNIVYIEENSWLWLPTLLAENDQLEIRFKLPLWAEVSAPWKQIDFNQHRYKIGRQPQAWGYRLLIGDFSVAHLAVDENRFLNVASVSNMQNSAEINQWLLDVGRALKSYLGDYPQQQTQIILVPKKRKTGSPVPWGDVSRGNGFGLLLVVVPSQDIKAFYHDWTAPHEFSHQLLPKLSYDDSWMSEGLSSYLQNILLVRSGHYTTEKAWRKLYQGFQRGERGTIDASTEPLSKTVSLRRKGGRTMRIYWSGASYFLKADIALRRKSNGVIGLNDILLRLNRCCIQSDKVWHGDELANKLDELSSTKIFSLLYHDIANSEDFPDYSSDLKQLGLSLLLSESTEEQIKFEPGTKMTSLDLESVTFVIPKNSMAWKIMNQ
jgi:hypothetical protein